MKRILITGASGFIGGFLVEEALKRNWEVTAAVRPTSNRRWLQDERIRFLELDFRDEAGMQEKIAAAGPFQYVIHNAGSTKEPNREAYFSSNFDNTRRLVEALQGSEQPLDKFLYVSSLAALGPARSGQWIKPGRPPAPVTHYGESKLASEEYLASQGGFPWVAVQPGAVFGPREKDIYIAIRLAYKGWAFLIGTKPQQLSFIYVEDLASLMYDALEHGVVGKKYLATDGKAYTNHDVGKAVSEVSGRRALTVKVPLPLVRVVAAISESVGSITGKTPPLNREKIGELAAESWLCDMTESFADLPFRPRYDLFEGMRETVHWYKTNNWL
ncbi:MAG: NAD-dependent epimerase/dehydratase family protein [Saprospiraceae bacterium]|nr:NAD-dependent epimerase/dehydratase family protein [Saprospiraceae bacterium]